jgi:hypothetical protein
MSASRSRANLSANPSTDLNATLRTIGRAD